MSRSSHLRILFFRGLFLTAISGGEALFAGRPMEKEEVLARQEAEWERKRAAASARVPQLAPPSAPSSGGAGSDASMDILFGRGNPAPVPGEPTADELKNLVPGGSLPPTAPTRPSPSAPPRTEAASKLLEVARRVAPAVVSLRAWDAHGNELARGCGFFLDQFGAILTDMQVVHPEFAAQIEYISVTTGLGTAHRITGVWSQNLESGLTVLQSDATTTPFVPLRVGVDFGKEQPVSIVALHENHGLTLADAMVKADTTRSGAGWLNLRGNDSPGEPGSPVIDAEGRVVALVSMRVPQGKWFNFGIRPDAVDGVLKTMARGSAPQPLSRLQRTEPGAIRGDPRFVETFQSLTEGNTVRATAQLLLLLKTYPRSAEVWGLLGLALAKSGAKEEAINCNRKAVALDPQVGQFWYQLAISHLGGSGGKPDVATQEALEQTVNARPADSRAWLLLAEQQVLDGQYAEAERSLIEVVKFDPNFAPASFLLGYTKGRGGDYKSAEIAMLRCVKLDAKHVRAWFYLALLYTKQARYPEAVHAYEEAVRHDPQHPHAWRNLALLQRRLGHETAAQLAYDHHRRLGLSQK